MITSVFRSYFTFINHIPYIGNMKNINKNKETQELSWENPKPGEKPNQPFLDRFLLILQSNHEQALIHKRKQITKNP
jgi:hypothetical protein